MSEFQAENETSLSIIKNLLVKFLLTAAIIYGFSSITHRFWGQHIEIYHTIFELSCVFIAVAIFISVWYNYEKVSYENCIIAFGFLGVAIFDALHIFYMVELNLNIRSYFDLANRYWILGRLTEALTILLLAGNIRKINDKRLSLGLTLTAIIGTSYAIKAYQDYLPQIIGRQGYTPMKIAMEYIIIGLFVLGFYLIRDRIKDDETIKYKSIFKAILMMISAEACIMLYRAGNSTFLVMGHTLKIASYYFVFQGVFISTVVYPYKRLELRNKELDEANMRLEEANTKVSYMSITLDDILNAIPFGIYLYGHDNRIKYVNKKFEELFECDRKDIHGLKREEFMKAFPWVDKDKNIIPVKDCLKSVYNYNDVRTIKLGEGKYRKLAITSKEINDGGLLLFNDYKKEQELKNLHLQTETILNAVSSSVVITDIDGEIILHNRALEEILEMSNENIMGLNINELHRMINLNINEKVELDRKSHEATLTTILGNKREILYHSAPISNIEGEIIGRIDIGNDVTELKKEHLKVRQQEKLALLGQLGAGIVHETRNFLTTIKGRSQIIEMVSEDEKVKEHAAKINTEIDEVNRIISEFLFLSKPRETELEEVSMYDIFQSIKNILQTSSIIKGVDTEFKLSKEERYLLCDEIQIKQVLLNICKNAVDAMSDIENPKLIIETGYNEAQNEMYIKIIDNGKGIAPKDLEKLGTMFFTTKKSGTGLGLNICYQIMQEHKGRIEVDSELGEGTTFTLILPCIEDLDEEEAI